MNPSSWAQRRFGCRSMRHMLWVRQRAMALLLVLIAVAMAATLAMTFVSSQATTAQISSNLVNQTKARYIAESGLRIAINYVKTDASWRTNRTNGTWVSNQSLSGGTFTVVGKDGKDADGDGVISVPSEGDNSLSDDSSDPLTLTVTGRYGTTSFTAWALMTPSAGGGPIAWWKLDESSGLTATDSSGNGNNGTKTNGPTWSTGVLEGCVAFDGSDDYIRVPAAATLDPSGDATIAGWFRLNSTFNSSRTTSQILVEKYNSDDADLVIALVGTDYGSTAPADGSIVFKLENGAGGEVYQYQSTTTASWSAGTWYHFACTIDSANAPNNKIYINGVDNTTVNGLSGSGGNSINMGFSADLNIGGKTADTGQLSSSKYINGRMDDVRLYDRVLTAEEIAALADSHGMTAHWTLDDGSGSTATESLQGANGSVSGASWTTGTLNGALSFDGNNDYVSLGTTCYATSAWTVAFWVKPNSPSTYERLFLQGDTGCGSRQLMVYWHSNRLEVRTVTNGAAGNPQAATATLTDHAWTHFAWTYNGSAHTLYLNGSVSSNSTNGSNVGVDGNNYLARRLAGNYFHGALDDVRIYNRALSSTEVDALANGTTEPGTSVMTAQWLPAP